VAEKMGLDLNLYRGGHKIVMIMGFFLIDPLRGDRVKEVSAIGRFLKEQILLIEKINQFADVRKTLQIHSESYSAASRKCPKISISSISIPNFI
jgi:hypothetical protein